MLSKIDLSKLKPGDIIYSINSGSKPVIHKMIIDTIMYDEHMFSITYNIKVKLDDGQYRFIEFYISSRSDSLIDNKAYIKTFNTSIISETNQNESYIIGFDYDVVVNSYIENIKKHIKLVEDTINRGKENLVELNEKLNYIQNQFKESNIQKYISYDKNTEWQYI